MNNIEEKIRKAANKFAEQEAEIGEIDRDALYKGFYHGANFALSNQWISVEDALPPYDTDILGMENESVYLCKRMGMCDGEDVYIINDAGEFSPTHWMPIPPLPKTREEDKE